MNQFGIGQPVRRVEDRRLLTGHGNHVRLLGAAPPGLCLHAALAACACPLSRLPGPQAPGVLAVLTGEDVAQDGPSVPNPIDQPATARPPRRPTGRPCPAARCGTSRYPVAAVVAGSPVRRARRRRVDRS